MKAFINTGSVEIQVKAKTITVTEKTTEKGSKYLVEVKDRDTGTDFNINFKTYEGVKAYIELEKGSQDDTEETARPLTLPVKN